MDYTCYISLDARNKTRGGNEADEGEEEEEERTEEEEVEEERVKRDQSSFINSFFASSMASNGTTHLPTVLLAFIFSFSSNYRQKGGNTFSLEKANLCGQDVTAAGTFLIMQQQERPVSSLIKRQKSTRTSTLARSFFFY